MCNPKNETLAPKVADIDTRTTEGKLLVAACYVLRANGPREMRDKDGNEILRQLQALADALQN